MSYEVSVLLLFGAGLLGSFAWALMQYVASSEQFDWKSLIQDVISAFIPVIGDIFAKFSTATAFTIWDYIGVFGLALGVNATIGDTRKAIARLSRK